MTPDEVTKLLKLLQKNQLESQLLSLTCQERIFALEAVVIALAPQAQEMLKRQIAMEHDKHQKEREHIHLMIRSLQSTLSEKPN
ncbi:MAG: hypothetical protein ABSE82_16035 [Nitrososphaerales archaeon]|jgi:hypothetical protein